jgi:CPA2 family monovalent cation:H+ antiporter-2
MEEIHHALTQIALVLAAAFAGGAIFHHMKQPALVGYIIVGIILGPSVLGLVENQTNIAVMAELGILLLLFIAGMELDLNRFKSVSRIAIMTCAAQITLGLATMFMMGHFFDWSLNMCILMGFAVSLSSTAVALKILEDMHMRSSRIGQVCVGVLIAQDIAVIPMILIVGALQSGEEVNYTGIMRLVLAVIVMGGLMYLLLKKPKFFERVWSFFERYKSKAMRGQEAITALAFCFTASALAGLFGLSAAYGAFLAGIALGHTMNRKELEQKAQPIFEVMIMVFFLSIGLLIDLTFLSEHLWKTLSILFITMLLKTVVNYAILRWAGMDRNESLVSGTVLSQVGEFSFILAAMGVAASTIDADGYKYVVAIISLSLLVSPLWLYLVNRFHLIAQVRLDSRRKRRALMTREEID